MAGYHFDRPRRSGGSCGCRRPFYTFRPFGMIVGSRNLVAKDMGFTDFTIVEVGGCVKRQ